MATRPRSLSMGDLFRSSNRHTSDPMRAQVYAQRLRSMMARAAESGKAVLESLLSSLPKVTENDLTALGHRDSSCPICLTPFLAILTEEEMALALDTPAHPTEDLGVTKLTSCGHLFCVKDIRNWVLQGHNTCPFCRSTFINLPEHIGIDETLGDNLDTALGRNAGFEGDLSGILSLTTEQLASLTSAIALLRQGDGLQEMMNDMHPTDVPLEDDDRHFTNHDSDRDDFAGMYS